jgi:hypothetical protein
VANSWLIRFLLYICVGASMYTVGVLVWLGIETKSVLVWLGIESTNSVLVANSFFILYLCWCVHVHSWSPSLVRDRLQVCPSLVRDRVQVWLRCKAQLMKIWCTCKAGHVLTCW